MSSVNEEYPTHVFTLLGAALNVAKQLAEAEIAGEPHQLRGSHLRLLSMTPPEGMRPTELAARVGITKQSLGEFVAALEQAGYVKVTVDLRDRRARMVTPTAKGRRLQQRIAQTFAETEERWKAAVGPRQWATFRKVLGHLAEDRGD